MVIKKRKKKLKRENARLAGTEMRDFLIFCNLDGTYRNCKSAIVKTRGVYFVLLV